MDNYELSYTLFLTESELFENLTNLGTSIIVESSNLELVQEGVKETILKYIEKISTAISKVWEKFKSIFENEKDKIYLKSISDKMQNPDPKFTMTNFPTYTFQKIESIKLVPFNYEEMKESLVSREDFLDKYYGAIDRNKSIIDSLRDMCITSRADTKCTAQLLKDMYKFCLSDFKSHVDKIEADLKIVNTSNKNIESMVNSIVSSTQESVSILEAVLFEAEEDEKKVEFKDDPNAKTEGHGKTEVVKHVTTYVKVSTDILTAKMNLYKEVYSLYMKTIKHYIKPAKEESEDNESVQSTETKTTTKVAQVKIN